MGTGVPTALNHQHKNLNDTQTTVPYGFEQAGTSWKWSPRYSLTTFFTKEHWSGWVDLNHRPAPLEEVLLFSLSYTPKTISKTVNKYFYHTPIRTLTEQHCRLCDRSDYQISQQETRRISTPRLNASLRFHLVPINVVISYGSQTIPNLGVGFPLRCFQRLSIPDIATRQCHWRDSR